MAATNSSLGSLSTDLIGFLDSDDLNTMLPDSPSPVTRHEKWEWVRVLGDKMQPEQPHWERLNSHPQFHVICTTKKQSSLWAFVACIDSSTLADLCLKIKPTFLVRQIHGLDEEQFASNAANGISRHPHGLAQLYREILYCHHLSVPLEWAIFARDLQLASNKIREKFFALCSIVGQKVLRFIKRHGLEIMLAARSVEEWSSLLDFRPKTTHVVDEDVVTNELHKVYLMRTLLVSAGGVVDTRNGMKNPAYSNNDNLTFFCELLSIKSLGETDSDKTLVQSRYNVYRFLFIRDMPRKDVDAALIAICIEFPWLQREEVALPFFLGHHAVSRGKAGPGCSTLASWMVSDIGRKEYSRIEMLGNKSGASLAWLCKCALAYYGLIIRHFLPVCGPSAEGFAYRAMSWPKYQQIVMGEDEPDVFQAWLKTVVDDCV